MVKQTINCQVFLKPLLTSLLILLVAATVSTGLFGLVGLVAQADIVTPLPAEFKQGKTLPQVTMVEFSAIWCLSCKKMKPEVEKLQKELGASLKIIYVDLDQPSSEKYINLYQIDSAPTFILYDRKGKQVERIERDITGTELRELVTKIQKQP